MTDDKTKQLVSNMVKDMRFERKKPVSKQEKTVYSVLEKSISNTMNDLGRLHLRLWHALNKSDYHSLSLDEVDNNLKKIMQNIDGILKDIKRA